MCYHQPTLNNHHSNVHFTIVVHTATCRRLRLRGKQTKATSWVGQLMLAPPGYDFPSLNSQDTVESSSFAPLEPPAGAELPARPQEQAVEYM